jgi:RNA polymerase sigma-B factor
VASGPQRKLKADRVPRALFVEYARTRDPAIREQLHLAHVALAAFLARRFAYRGEPLEDISQVAQLGLLQAIDRFDPEREVEFSTYATATIVGEIKRYFRDKTWSVHVPRRLRERNNALMRALDTLTGTLGRSPTIQELADVAGVSFEDAVEILEVGLAYSPASLDAEVRNAEQEEASSLLEYLGTDDPAIAHAEDQQTLEKALRRLPEREQLIIRLRYYDDYSQAEIAKRLGISQMHVSRLQRQALNRLRLAMSDASITPTDEAEPVDSSPT